MRILFLFLLFLLVPLFFVGFLAYHLPRQAPRAWRRTAVLVMLASTVPAAMLGDRVLDGQPAGVALAAVAGSILTGVLLVHGKRVYDGRRAASGERAARR